MRIIHLSLVAISCLIISGCKYSFFAQCVKSLTNDGFSGNSVAISDQFAAVGEFFRGMVSGSSYSSPKTLIRNINDGSTTFIEGFGELSLDVNIL